MKNKNFLGVKKVGQNLRCASPTEMGLKLEGVGMDFKSKIVRLSNSDECEMG